MQTRYSHPRGSILIFAIVLLAILSMLGTAFLLTVRQSSASSSSSITNKQADTAAQSGIYNLLRVLRSNVVRNTIFTQDSVFSVNAAGFRYSPASDPGLSPLDAVQPSMNAYAIQPTAGVSPLLQFRGFDPNQPRAALSPDTSLFVQEQYTSEPFGALRYPATMYLATGVAAGTSTAQVSLTAGAPYSFTLFNIYVGEELSVDSGAGFETVLVAAVNPAALTFTAIFAKPHAASATTAPMPIAVPEYARQNVVYGGVGDFYQHSGVAVPFIKDQGYLAYSAGDNSGVRGDYYIWVSDLDSKLYAAPGDWYLDNTPPLTGTTDYTATTTQIATGVLNTLNVFSAGDVSALVAASTNNAIGDSRNPAYRSNAEVALALNYAPGPNYVQARNTLDQYLSSYKDVGDFSLLQGVYASGANIATPSPNLRMCFCKDWSTAININTAPLEVISSALSQIPCDYALRSTWASTTTPIPAGATIGQVPCLDGIALSVHLANRIIAKRPFLCRMDFEDFLAAQILGTIGSETANSDSTTDYNPTDDYLSDNQVLPPDSDPMWWTNDYWDDPSLYTSPTTAGSYFPSQSAAFNPPVTYFIYYAIGRRWGPGNTTFHTPDPTLSQIAPASDPYMGPIQAQIVNPELSLSQWLEMPNVQPTDPNFTMNVQINGAGAPVPVTANTPAFQKARFRYFVGTAAERSQVVYNSTTNTGEGSLITCKEFNNIINSVTTIFVNNDMQTIFPGQPGPGMCVTAVTPGTINTTPQGDDRYVYNAAGTQIIGIDCGPNNVAETWVSAYRPSYYNFCDDVTLGDGILTTIQATYNGGPPASATGALNDYAVANPTPSAFYTGTPSGAYPNYPFSDGTLSMLDPAISVVPLKTPPAKWAPYFNTTWGANPTIAQVIGDPTKNAGLRYQTKFFYLYRLDPGTPQMGMNPPIPPTITSTLETTDLIFWRCRPFPDPNGFNNIALPSNGRSGFYQMSFDDWTYNTTPPTYDMGNMQASGDPSDTTNMYSSAVAPQSGLNNGSGANHNGDCNWSPQFAYRSRFFGVYVLGRGLTESSAGIPQTTGSTTAGSTLISGIPVSMVNAVGNMVMGLGIPPGAQVVSATANSVTLNTPATQSNAGVILNFSTQKVIGERRIEAVYDALEDQILWQRAQASDKRSMGD